MAAANEVKAVGAGQLDKMAADVKVKDALQTQQPRMGISLSGQGECGEIT